MAIENLVTVVAPPAIPVEVGGPDQRRQVEARLGLRLPDDYWDYADRYGSGTFQYRSGVVGLDIRIWNPFSPSFQEFVEQECDNLRVLKRSKSGEQVPFDVFPLVPGLFPVGADDNGNAVYWLIGGDANSWPIVVWPESGGRNDFKRFRMPLTAFLASAFRGELFRVGMWGKPFFEDPQGTTFEADK